MAVELLARVHAEIEERMVDLRPAVAEWERLTGATDALGVDPSEAGELPKRPALRTPRAPQAPRTTRAPRTPRQPRRKQPGKAGKSSSAAEQAIVAALEHGSHTVAELVLVSALPGTDIRAALRPLLRSGTVTRARRDGRAAYALPAAA